MGLDDTRLRSNILITTHYNHNIGDKAILAGLLSLLEATGVSHATISVYDPASFDPRELPTHVNLDIIGWGLKRKTLFNKALYRLWAYSSTRWPKWALPVLFAKEFMRAAKANLVLVTGGHHLTDILSDSILYQLAADMVYCLQANPHVILLPQTIGPLKNIGLLCGHKLRLIDYIVRHADHVYVRDNVTKEWLTSVGLTRRNIVKMPDLAFGLFPKVVVRQSSYSINKQVGICVYANYAGDRQKLIYREIQELSGLISNLIALGYRVEFIPMEARDSHADDRKLINKIIENVKDTHMIRIADVNNGSLSLVLESIRRNDLIISYKTHGILLALLQGVPVIGIAYHPKSIEIMHDYSMGKYALYDKDVNRERLLSLIEDLYQEYPSAVDVIVEHTTKRWILLVEEFKRLLSALVEYEKR